MKRTLRLRSGHALFVTLALLLVAAAWPRGAGAAEDRHQLPDASGASWHLYLAKEGGYYNKYGLDVDIQFGVHPTGVAMLTSGQAVMVNHSLEQAMVASARDGSFALMGSTSNRGLFALIAQKTFTIRSS
jgi:ABC-type nitrate/sulfonate/bicarbonate transport system substrate-binding protein